MASDDAADAKASASSIRSFPRRWRSPPAASSPPRSREPAASASSAAAMAMPNGWSASSRAAGNARVGCGFITWSLARQPQLLDQVLAHAPAAIMLSFGDPAPFAARDQGGGRAADLPGADHGACARGGRRPAPTSSSRKAREAGGHGARARRSPSCRRSPIICAKRAGDAAVRGGRHCRRARPCRRADARRRRRAGRLALLGERGGAWCRSACSRRRSIADGDATIRTTVVDIVRKLTGRSNSPRVC